MTRDHQGITRQDTPRDHQPMCDEDIREIIDAAVTTTIIEVLKSFGIEEEDRRELQADFSHLRRWRKSVEQAQTFTFKAVITIIVSGLMGALWLGLKAMLGK